MAAMRLILGATRLDERNDGAANLRVYLKQACQANRRVPKNALRRRFPKEEVRASQWILLTNYARRFSWQILAKCAIANQSQAQEK
jgi:hypothetical protein